MLQELLTNWNKYTKGYKYKSNVDAACKKNMDVYCADVSNDTYLPQYSARENPIDYTDRQKRSKNAFMNFPEKIIEIYQNSIFRSGQPNRPVEDDRLKRFIKDVDGGGTHIGKFVKDFIFLYNQIHGGCAVVIDKPRLADQVILSQQDKESKKLFPYAYIYQWPDIVYFTVDRHKQLNWILFQETVTRNGEDVQQYRYFDRSQWAVIESGGNLADEGSHNLKTNPVILSFHKRDAKYNFLTPKSAIDNIIRLSLKIFEYQSQLEQTIVMHAFAKLAMPESMFEKLNGAQGAVNAYVFPDGATANDRAYYIELPETEIKTLIELVYDKLPNKILYFATIRDKVAMPREESGEAKFIDSGDEIANLLDKAENMEWVENQMIRKAALWESMEDPGDLVTYNKVFDIKSTNEQISEIVSIFKEDLGSPTFNKMMSLRLMKNMLGYVTDKDWDIIKKEVENAIDPALSIEDIDKFIDNGVVNVLNLAKKFNPELREKSDEEIKQYIRDNLELQRGAVQPTPFNEPEPTE